MPNAMPERSGLTIGDAAGYLNSLTDAKGIAYGTSHQAGGPVQIGNLVANRRYGRGVIGIRYDALHQAFCAALSILNAKTQRR
jgi:hypothetical protein